MVVEETFSEVLVVHGNWLTSIKELINVPQNSFLNLERDCVYSSSNVTESILIKFEH